MSAENPDDTADMVCLTALLIVVDMALVDAVSPLLVDLASDAAGGDHRASNSWVHIRASLLAAAEAAHADVVPVIEVAIRFTTVAEIGDVDAVETLAVALVSDA